MTNKNHLKAYFLVFSLLVAVGVVGVINIDNTVAIKGAVDHKHALPPVEKTSDVQTVKNGVTTTVKIELDVAKTKEFIVTPDIKGNDNTRHVFIIVNGEIKKMSRINFPDAPNIAILKDGSIIEITGLDQNIVNFKITISFSGAELLDENTLKSSLFNAEPGEYRIKDKSYTVIPIISGGSTGYTVIFRVNDQNTDPLFAGQAFELKDDYEIKNLGAGYSTRGDIVTFSIGKRVSDLVVEIKTINSKIPKFDEIITVKTFETVTVISTIKNIGNADFVDFTYNLEYGDDREPFALLIDKILTPGESTDIESTHTYARQGIHPITAKVTHDKGINTIDNVHTVRINVEINVDEDGVPVGPPEVKSITKTEFFDDSINLVNGDSLISVTPEMVGVSISQMSNADSIPEADRCETVKFVWLYIPSPDAPNFGWRAVRPSNLPDVFLSQINIEEFGPEHVDFGMWITIENPNGCKLGCGASTCVPGVK